MVAAWGQWDTSKAWLLSDCLGTLVAGGQRRVVLDIGEVELVGSDAAVVLSAAVARARRAGTEVAVVPHGSVAAVALRLARPVTTEAAVEQLPRPPIYDAHPGIPGGR